MQNQNYVQLNQNVRQYQNTEQEETQEIPEEQKDDAVLGFVMMIILGVLSFLFVLPIASLILGPVGFLAVLIFSIACVCYGAKGFAN